MDSGLDGALYVTDSDGNLKVFNVERNENGLWLNSNYGNPDNFWNGDNRWVFIRRNSLLLLNYNWGVCFSALFNQLPSILPTSTNSCPT